VKSILLVVATASSLSAATCESLASLSLPSTTITAVESRSGGEFAPPTGQLLRNLPAFCRVAGIIRPSSDSEIRFEVWLPAAGWNGKFRGAGNPGFAGSVNFAVLADAVRHNYASASTDTGHTDNSGTSAAWALNHPEKVVDYGYRAIHLTTVNAKAIVAAFYGQGPRYAYFNSCSNGGREGLMEAQRYPADYDGIIAGAPANDGTGYNSMAAFVAKSLLADPASYIPTAKLPAIEAAALAQCDAKDGVKDGVIENPLACRFDPSVLLCKDRESDACLTTPELTALKAIYRGLRDSKGNEIFPGFSYGGEAESGGWATQITGPAPEKSLLSENALTFFGNMVYGNPAWQYRAFDPDRDPKIARDRLGSVLNATDPNLSAFQQRGGKLILFHGWTDAAISPMNTIHYFDSVTKKLGAKTSAEFLRLYMVPGMGHCGGGAGVASWPNGWVPPDADRFHSIDAALEGWVEQGTAPAEIIATKYKDNRPGAPVERSRPVCPWPQTAKYKGTGSIDDAGSFHCAK
jgi:hypothetical protein